MLECKNDRNKGHVIGVCKRVCTFLWKKKLLCFAREKIGKMSVCVCAWERERIGREWRNKSRCRSNRKIIKFWKLCYARFLIACVRARERISHCRVRLKQDNSYLDKDIIKAVYDKGRSPGESKRTVIGGDSNSKGRGFESWHFILDGHFFTYICCKNFNDVCLKRSKIYNKRGWGWPI